MSLASKGQTAHGPTKRWIMSKVEQLVSLGVDRVKAQYALTEYDGHVEAAADWCFGEGLTWTPADLLNLSYKQPEDGLRQSADTASASVSERRAPMALDVPRAHQVRVGVRVNVVMKQDQPTGRTVQGVVSQVLSKGDHPRGIKVRLENGTVGRVVSIA